MTTYTPQSEDTVEGFLDTLTGFDELAIAHHFQGLDPYVDGDKKPVLVLRALIFIDQTRREKLAPDAKNVAMSMPLGQAQAYFVDESTEQADPTTLETPSGEGEPAAV